MKIDGRMFCVRQTCSECGCKLNASKHYNHIDMQKNWLTLVLSVGFSTPRCPKCSYSTFSDMNIGTENTIYDVKTNRPVAYALFKLLSGRFYSDDRDDICRCDKTDGVYTSEKHPVKVHGSCGKFIKPYRDLVKDKQ